MGETAISADFCTEELAPADRFGYLRELMALAPAPMDISSEEPAGFLLRQRDVNLDAARVWSMEFQSMDFHRTGKMVSRSDPESYNICLLQRGSMTLAWDRREATFCPAELHTIDFSRPFGLRARSIDGPVSCIGIELPKRLLPIPRDQADRIVGRPIPADTGMGVLLSQFLVQVTSETAEFRAADGVRLGVVAADLVSALFAHVLETDDRLVPPENHRRTLVTRIRAFIRQHLDDPGLTPRAIAAAHHISPSYLHRLFQDEEVTVAALIRRERMECARRDLADSALHATPIHAIASRWGYSRAADFTRAFRSVYGMPPKDYRHRALRAVE